MRQSEARIYRGSKANRDARFAALARDKRKCRECGKRSPHIHVHHVVPWAPLPWMDDLENLLTLCPACHRKAHAAGLRCTERTRVEFEFVEV